MPLSPKSLWLWISRLMPSRRPKLERGQLVGLYLNNVNGSKPRIGGIPDPLRRKDGKFSQNRQRV